MNAVTGQQNLKFQIDFESSVNGVREALAEVLRKLSTLDLGVEESSTVELVLAEILNNVVEHAYAGGAGKISIQCHQEQNGLHFTILDHGIPMPEGGRPIGALPPMGEEIDDLPEGGFGWFLIDGLARDIEYLRADKVNLLRFRVAVAAKAQ